MAKDNLKPTGRRGVFFIEHPTRKNGVRKDRQFVLRYTISGETRKEVFGWASEGKTELDAELKIQEFRANTKAGEGPTSLREEKEKRQQEEAEAEHQRTAMEMEARRRNTTLNLYFYDSYLEVARTSKKPRTVGSEIALYEKWIKPSMGDKVIREIKPLDFKRLQKKVLDGDLKKDPETGKMIRVPKSPRTVHYVVSIIMQIWNMAFDNGVVDIQPPRRKTLNLPMIDNERTRAFTQEQSGLYFEKMAKRSPQWHDISMVSLFAGLRASEVFRLEVDHFDEIRRQIFLKTPKKKKSQYLVLNDTAFALLKRLKESHPTGIGLFFTNTKGEVITEVSDTVQRVIDDLGFNDGVKDSRDKLTFHSWRHTYATWLLDGGADIYTISQLLRHSSLAQTKKYVHPHEERLRAAAKALDEVVAHSDENKKQEGNA